MPRISKGRTRQLTRDDFVTAALEYIELHGAAGLTARTLGESMNVDPTALYRHFPGMDELAGSVLDRLFAEMGRAEIPDGTPRERLRAHVLAIHEVFYKHPNVIGLILVSKGNLPHADALMVQSLDLLRDLGLRSADLALCHQMLESFVVGTHLYDLGGAPYHLEIRRQRRRRVDDPDIDLSTPTNESVNVLNRAAFLAGVDALLDFCESLASKSGAAKRPAAKQSAAKAPAAKATTRKTTPASSRSATGARKK